MALSFLKKGAESTKLAAKAAAEVEQRKLEQGKMFRFYMKDKEQDARITFVDGALEEGILAPPRFYEHNLFLHGEWGNLYYCPEKTDPEKGDKCPICASGDRPYLVALFTIMDHRQIPSKKDPKKVYKDQPKLFAAKAQTFELLNKQAMKRGGLAGCTFEVSRVGDKSAAVGSVFEFVEKKSIEELQKLYMIEKVDPVTNKKSMVTQFVPANYEKEIDYRTGDELRKLLSGETKSPDDVPFDEGSGAPPVDYTKDL